MMFDGPVLSVLIASLHSRRYLLQRLLGTLNDQRNLLSYKELVQLLVLTDDGETAIGIKRNSLVNSAVGTYVSFVDDDDTVAGDYLQTIIDLSDKHPDVMELRGEFREDGGQPRPFFHSIKYKDWSEDKDGYYRPPCHLSPIKRTIATQFPFPPVRVGEDFAVSKAMANSGLLRKEAACDKVLYFYDYKSNKPKIGA